MAEDPLVHSLQDHVSRTGKPLCVMVLYTGGTFACIENAKGNLEPVQDEKQLERLFLDGLNLQTYVDKQFLTLSVTHLFAMDSSQMRDEDREKIITTLYAEYAHYDGFIIIHGTDTGAETAKFLHLALPYNNPLILWKEKKHQFNWIKPVILLSSQVPAGLLVDGRLTPRMHSDGPMNLALAIIMIAEGVVGESGIITNNEIALRGIATTKGAEIDIPPYRSDPGVASIATYTAMGLRYSAHGFLRKIQSHTLSTPTVIQEAYKHEKKVLSVQDTTHLKLIICYLNAKESKNTPPNASLIEYLKEQLPEIILYETRGAGNVKEEDYQILKRIESEGIIIFRVPIPGGRIPQRQIYEVPGHDIIPLNMQLQTARYKSMMSLALGHQLGIKGKNKIPFIEFMMMETWGNEFLPQR